MSNQHIVIYSHGFGVMKDDRGLFTDISKSIPGATHVLTDFNSFDEKLNELTVSDMQTQKRKLVEAFDVAKSEHPNATFDLICHSQGCVVAALAGLKPIRKTLFLAPPSELNAEKMIRNFSGRAGTNIDINGQSRIARRDGTTTIVPASYWKSIKLNVLNFYNRLPDNSEVLILEALDDEVLRGTNFDKTDERIELTGIRGDHNFSGENRKKLVEFVKEYLEL